MLILRIPTPTHFRVRALEWGLAAVLVSSGTLLINSLDIFSAPEFSQLRIWGDDTFWGTVFLVVGLARLAALYVNGSWVPSPWVRLFTAMASATIWGLVTLGLLTQGNDNLLLAVFPWFVLADIYSVGRASADARLSRDERMSKPEAPRVMSLAE